MKFVFEATTHENDIVSVSVACEDPNTMAPNELLGELTMFQHQWDILKPMLVEGSSYFLSGEGSLLTEEFIA